MTLLIYDTETTGVPGKDEPISSPRYPRIIQLAMLLIDTTGRELASASIIIKPEGFTIPDDMAKIHGIDTDMAMTLGIPVRLALALFTNMRASAQAVVGHNEGFDANMVAAELHRLGAQPASPGPTRHIDTAYESAGVVQLPPTESMIKWRPEIKYKTPNLTELHNFLFGKNFDGAHNALADVQACARCLLSLRADYGICL